VSGNTFDIEVIERQPAIDDDLAPLLFVHGVGVCWTRDGAISVVPGR
jgi:hypothetical protein